MKDVLKMILSHLDLSRDSSKLLIYPFSILFLMVALIGVEFFMVAAKDLISMAAPTDVNLNTHKGRS